jgi:16S rRNA (guanine1207-N2)-methyltransferase
MRERPAPDGQGPDHYFSAETEAASRERRVQVTARGLTLQLWTDAGMFSPGHVDRGSLILAKALQLRAGTRVLDWGAGYGFLGILAARLCPDCHVTMVEINQRAAALAERNVRELRLANARVISGAAPEALGDETYDVVISNPPLHAGRPAVDALIADAAQRLTPGGELWLVVPTRKGARGFLAYMAERLAETRTVDVTGGYRVLWGRKAGA